jgi:hypothetical protein
VVERGLALISDARGEQAAAQAWCCPRCSHHDAVATLRDALRSPAGFYNDKIAPTHPGRVVCSDRSERRGLLAQRGMSPLPTAQR